MKRLSTVHLLIVFAVTFSLVSLAGPLAADSRLPGLQLAHANIQFCQTKGASGACSEFWYPAGPAMDTELASIFTNGPAEFTNIQSASPSIDFTDWPLTPLLASSFASNPNLLVTAPISSHSYFEIQFMMANNFWGINMNYGNNPNGTQIRQGIVHMIDKAEFVISDPNIGGAGSAIDNPLPPSNGGLPSPNPCNWDSNFAQSGSNCVVGASGGTAYHIAAATGADGLGWLPAPGSKDLDAAAAHFVNAGIATGCDLGTGPASCVSSSDSRLSGISASAAAHVPTFFIRSDDLARLDLGTGLAAEICYIFTGSYSTPCSYLNTIPGPITAFPGFQTSKTGVNLSWWMYTAGYLGVYPFDQSLYFTYNSRFVSGVANIRSPSGACSAQSVASASASDYMYLCSPSYDSISSQMEFSPCRIATGDPSPGQPSNGPGGDCSGTSKLSAVSAGVQSEDTYGKNAFSIPVFTTSQQYGYLNGWSHAINNEGLGVPNLFTWLNAWNPTSAQFGTIRQAFAEGVGSVNPYIASTAWDFYLIGNIYDSLDNVNPLSNAQLMDWMTTSSTQLPNSSLDYSPPIGTNSTFRVTLRNDMYWQDGRRVTPWDVKFSYLTLLATGAFQGSQLSSITGVTVISPTQVDLNINAAGPFTEISLTSPTIIPGRYWSTCSGSIWDGYISTNQVPNNCMQADPNKITAFYDPLANGILIGSGAWMCKSSTGTVGGPCSNNGFTPGASSFTLSRFGTGVAPASSLSGSYFRSSGNLALWFWSEDTGDLTHDFLNFSVVAACVGVALVPLGTVSGCGHFQQGMGTNGATTPGGTGGCPTGSTCGIRVGLTQVSIVSRFLGLNWIAPFNWLSSPPTGIVSLAPTLYEGLAPNPLPIGYPAFTPGVPQVLNPASVAGCTSAYPTGGYDC